MGLFDLFFGKKKQTYDEKLEIIQNMALPAVHLVESSTNGFSRLGGIPDVPAGFVWPSFQGKPLAFLAQMKLSDFPSTGKNILLPSTGLLYFFYDQDQSTWGFDPKDAGSWSCIYHSDETCILQKSAVPEGLVGSAIYEPKNLKARVVNTFPNWEEESVKALELTEEEFDTFLEFRVQDFNGFPQHQLGGWPHPIQAPDMYNECQLVSNGIYLGNADGHKDPRSKELLEQAKDWKLLFQVDSDEGTNMHWGDDGRLYFWIREQDLESKKFDSVWMILQCG